MQVGGPGVHLLPVHIGEQEAGVGGVVGLQISAVAPEPLEHDANQERVHRGRHIQCHALPRHGTGQLPDGLGDPALDPGPRRVTMHNVPVQVHLGGPRDEPTRVMTEPVTRRTSRPSRGHFRFAVG